MQVATHAEYVERIITMLTTYQILSPTELTYNDAIIMLIRLRDEFLSREEKLLPKIEAFKDAN